MNEKLTLPLSIIIAGLFIGGGIYLNGKMAKENPTPAQQTIQQQQAKSENLENVLKPVDANDHVLGNPKARILIIEYSDTECPFCKMFHSTLISIMQEYGTQGEVAWVYRHFPVYDESTGEYLHSKAPKEAEALECAGELGGDSKFWEYTNKIYEITPSNDGLDPKQLTTIATGIGLSSNAFNTCLESGQYTARVQADLVNAQELGASGTPYSVVVDTKTNQYYPLDGAYPYADLKNAIELILNS